jgi:L-threonylcarbamoyladenylate synthase
MKKKTKILTTKKTEDIIEAISLIRDGRIVAVPTETVYGLAADARNEQAVEKIFAIKNRPRNHPLIVHIESFDKLSEWAKDIPPVAKKIAEHFWPGPITMLLKKSDSVSHIVTGGLYTIAVRVPKNKSLLKILKTLNTGLAAPSANPHTKISPTSAQHVLDALSGKIDAVLDDGECKVGVESTIIDLTKNTISILRHGPITKKMIEKVIGRSIDSPEKHLEKVSGNMKAHYQPYTKTKLLSLEDIEHCLTSNKKKVFGVIHYSSLNNDFKNIKAIKLPRRREQYSKAIYKALHSLDKENVYQILVERPPKREAWNVILDRLTKASSD